MDRILTKAKEAVYGDRNLNYGNPADNHARTAILWRAHLLARYGIELPLDEYDVCWMNIAQKQSRDMHVHKEDNYTDTAGFAENMAWMTEEGDELWDGSNLVGV